MMKRTGMRPRKGDIFVVFRADDGVEIKELIFGDRVTEKHRAALKASRDAWFDAIHPVAKPEVPSDD